MRRTAAAPASAASQICPRSTMKSLRSTGRSTAAATARRSSSEPPKYVGSVRTEIASAPAAS